MRLQFFNIWRMIFSTTSWIHLPTVYLDEILIYSKTQEDTKPIAQRRYRMNPNYVALKVKEEIDKLLRVSFIRLVKQATILVVPKKNRKIRVCVDYRMLNVVTVTNGFSPPFMDRVFDVVAAHEVYSFLDGFSAYNQI